MFIVPYSSDVRRGSTADIHKALRGQSPQYIRKTPCDGLSMGSLTALIPHKPPVVEYSGHDFTVKATIYSYWTPVVTLVRKDWNNVLLLWSSEKFSTTTSRHIRGVTYSLDTWATYSVAVPDIRLPPVAMFKGVLKDCQDLFDKVLRAKVYASYQWDAYNRRLQDARFLAEFFGLPGDFIPPHKSPDLTAKAVAKLAKLRLAGVISN